MKVLVRNGIEMMNVHPINLGKKAKELLLFKGAEKTSSRPAWWMSCLNRTGKSSKPVKKQHINFEKDGRKTSKVIHHLA